MTDEERDELMARAYMQRLAHMDKLMQRQKGIPEGFKAGDRVEIAPVQDWLWQVHYPDSVGGATGTVIDVPYTGFDRVVVQFDEQAYEDHNLGQDMPGYLAHETVPRAFALKPRQIRLLQEAT